MKKNYENKTSYKGNPLGVLLRNATLTILLLTFSILKIYADSTVQSKKLTISVMNETLGTLFEKIEKESGFYFFYDANDIDVSRKVTLSVNDADIEEILGLIFKNSGTKFETTDSYIILNKENKTKNLSSNTQQQQNSIKGKITDPDDLPLPGATIVVVGTTRGVITDVDGTYSIQAKSNDKLEFSFLGMKTQIIDVDNQSAINVKMNYIADELEEITVVAYGTQKKISLIGSQSSVESKSLQVPAANLTNALVGQLSGVVGVQRTGEPGFDDSDIWIRGISTFSQGLSKPLFLVDGVPRNISNVDPEDIESFTVLKDASATALYGVRGANGVIIVTTKKGKAGKPKFSFRYYEGLTKFTKLPEFADGPTYMRMSNEALSNRGASPIYSDEVIQMTQDGTDPYLYPNVNWMKELFNDFGHQRRGNLNISGGSENATYYVGVSYFDEVGLYKQGDLDYNNQTGYKRYNLTSNLSIQGTKTTKIDLGVQGYLANANYPGSGQGTIFDNAFYLTPVLHPVKYEDGKIADQRAGSLSNPYAHLTESGYANQWRNQLYSNLRVTQDLPFITEGLSITGLFSFDVYNYTSMRRTKRPDTYMAIGRDEDGNMLYEETYRGDRYLSFSRNSNGERTIYVEGAVNYNKRFDRHSVSGMLLFNQSDMLNSQAGDFNSSLPYRYLGMSGRGTYEYDDRYFIEFNFGYNGSENFAPKKQFGFFPSIGLGWLLSEEKFFEPATEFVQKAKFRFSHGTVGNSQITGRRFAYLSTIDSKGGYSFGKERNNNYGGYDIGEYGVNVTWETSTKTNLGIDLGLINNELDIQFDWFTERREGIFLKRASVPAYVGLQSAPYGNLGIIENKGIDGSMTFSKRINDFSFQVLGNFTFSRNEIIENDQALPTYPWMDQKGRKVGQRFGLNALGLFETEEEISNSALHPGLIQPGDIKFQDVNGDGRIDDFDRIPMGYGTVPEVVYGFGITLGYKNLSLSSLFQGVGNVDVFMNGEGVTPFPVSMSRGNLLSNIEDRWTIEDPRQDVFYPRLSDGSPNNNYATSTWWLKNGRYLRLKNLQLTYSLPKDFVKKIGIDDANIFLSGLNVFTWSPFKFWDVELGDGKGSRYPNTATYSIGIDFKF